jgi:hypothetical protein
VINNEDIVFYLEDGSSIGFIERIPEIKGNYKYEPFRGLGHYRMSTQIQAGSRVKCYVQVEKKRIEFLVKNILEYGVIEVEMN